MAQDSHRSARLIRLKEGPQSLQTVKQVGAIRALGTRMMERVKDLLNVHAIEAGRVEAPQIVTMDLCFAVEKALARAATAASKKGIALEFPDSASLEVKGDPTHLGRVLDQLLNNALKFSPPGTAVTVLLADDSEQGRILVQDQGPASQRWIGKRPSGSTSAAAPTPRVARPPSAGASPWSSAWSRAWAVEWAWKACLATGPNSGWRCGGLEGRPVPSR